MIPNFPALKNTFNSAKSYEKSGGDIRASAFDDSVQRATIFPPTKTISLIGDVYI